VKELLDILKVSRLAHHPTALATIVQTTGSSYRRAGARMLILPDGRTVGCISGGCLDQDVVRHGLSVIKSRKPAVVTYDSSAEGDLILGTGLGCNGMIDILVEFLPERKSEKESDCHLLGFLDGLIRRRRTGAAATVVKTVGEVQLALGDRVILDENGSRATNLFDGCLAEALEKCAWSAFDRLQPEVVKHESTNGSALIFAERFLPQRNLVILGAGHDAIPVARLAYEMGLRVSVVDGRPAYATRERFPTADEVVPARPENREHLRLFDSRTAAVIMTHNYLTDQEWLKQLLPLRLPYLGLMGPRKRAEKMLLELRLRGLEMGERLLQPLHNPIGLDIGAETPEQIALAILAEVQAAATGHEGGKLRQKKGTIRLPPLETKLQSFLQSLGPEGHTCARSG
jgi:xanthine/CO dehydrogenase XdhC/CoxF family maturation factor